MIIIKKWVAVAAIALSSSTVFAADISLLGSSLIDTTATTKTFTSGSISVVASAPVSGALIAQSTNGLGVKVDALDGNDFDACCSFTGAVANESMKFTFNAPVTIGGISFNSWDNGIDNVKLTSGATSITLTQSTSGGGLSSPSKFIFSSPLQLSSFTLTTNGSILVSTRVASLLNVNPVATVPLPAAAWLMGSALMGLFGVKRKKR